ncbi:hypothetical protein N657DRAFT_653551 [Parathielavia appendiculata]|uniref:Uncharacterized protein n=1 Tax=Parathielavia appendiculata TaxID=2587402 RepID=A0AAN6U6H0_9PEZI|nr:hypothetical protein N657DRAFT_653551 [Parathielavia appendiculata]
MQAVPSLVGTGTAAAAAAVGLVFGQPLEPEMLWSSPIQHRFPADYDGFRAQPVPPRPSTSAAANYYSGPSPAEDFPYSSFRQLADAAPGPLTSHPLSPTSPTTVPRPLTGVSISSPRFSSRRHSFVRPGDLASQPIAETARDSVSSRDSWIRRLSLRPLSQHGSRRSSMGPDSSSVTLSHGSGVPMLGQSPSYNTGPNKLVKRATSGQNGAVGGMTRRNSKSQVLTLRRPATSHQRSATLQQFHLQGTSAEPLSPDFSIFPDNHNPSPTSPVFPTAVDNAPPSGKWTSFFHARRSTSYGREVPGLPPGNSPLYNIFPRRRVSLASGHVYRAYLTKPSDIIDISEQRDGPGMAQDQGVIEEKQGSSHSASDPSDSIDSTSDRPPRRSLSMHFNSASQWISRTGSARRPRRSTIDSKPGGGRYLPEPGAAQRDQTQPPVQPRLVQIRASSGQQPDSESKPADLPRTRKRNSSSPLPPSNRLSSFNIDVTRIGLPTPPSTGPSRSVHGPINYSQASSTTTHSRGPSGERSATLAGSDVSARDAASGDDEDTDFRSDGMYDSFRTGASSSRVRSVETPLESMFDDSPPGTASNGRAKRLSIQEMLGRSWDGETKITEEDEGIPTPIRPAHFVDAAEFEPQGRHPDNFKFDAAHGLSVADSHFGRLSFDDDDDDDWPRDDDNTLSNHLSPPSSTNSRRVSPTLRHALRNISGNGSHCLGGDSMSDRPRSNIFDWSEPSAHDKFDTDMPRPKTVHGKQELDLRGGRSTSRKLPGAAHIRSQSVPVVPDPTDGSKPAPKFGTWGLGTKTASEDWDDDFEFDGEEAAVCSPGGKDSATSFSMVVPASIQATQPSVRAHSGQIRELSLLVNDLKRLCRHGKELDILRGPMATKWAEAESIIALASPDEEDDDDLSWAKSSMDLDRSKVDDRFQEEGFDGPFFDHTDDPFAFPEPEMSKTAVVRERHSPRRRSVFSPEDDIFGNWPLTEGTTTPARPRTPSRCSSPSRNSTIISTVIEAMKQQRKSASDRVKSPAPKPTHNTELFFDTNSLQELVKRAGQLRDSLSDAVRRAELLTQSPAGTPRRERHSRHQNPDGSPAFTRVFVEPASSPPRRLPNSHSTTSILSRASVESPRMQMMTVS